MKSRLAILLSMVLLGSGFQQPTPVPGGLKGYAGGGVGNPFILTQTLGTPLSNFDGALGFIFMVGGSNITVTHLGRWKIAGNSATHTVSIFDNGNVLVVSASVDMTTGSAGTYVYTSITPTVLTSGLSYKILSCEVNGGDQWYNDATTVDSVASYASMVSSCFQISCSGSITPNAIGSFTYVPVNFKTS